MDPSITASTSEQASASLIATAPVVADSLEFMMGLHSCGEDPPALLAAVSVPPKTSPLADAGFLTCLPITDPVAQRNATYLIQLLRPFPQMMVRRAAFPPFIHPNWHRGDGADAHKTLPEPISHCISIAQMFSLRTPDTRTFVWNTVRTEQRRLMDQVGQPSLSSCPHKKLMNARVSNSVNLSTRKTYWGLFNHGSFILSCG